MTNVVIQLFGNKIPELQVSEGVPFVDDLPCAERQEESPSVNFPAHVLMLSDWFADEGDVESAFRILDGYEAHGEAYIAGFCDYVQYCQTEAIRVHSQQGSLFGADLNNGQS